MVKIDSVKVTRGIAGQVSADVDGQTTFVGSVYGGPVVMVWPNLQTFVADPGRFGDFGANPEAWVRRFYA